MLKREILLTSCAIVLALSGQDAKAAEACTTTPTCAALGYTVTTCNGFVSLKCPFDTTKLFCGSDRCDTGYYRYSDTECVLGNRQVIKSGSTAIGVAVSSNLAVAMTDEGAMSWDNAIAKCKAKTTGGKSWRLPTKDELVAMKDTYKATYATLQVNGGAGMYSSWCWSSTESSSTLAWGVIPGNGLANGLTKAGNFNVRCVFNF